MKKLFRYMVIATMIVIFIYSVFCGRSKNGKQPDIGVAATIATVPDTAATAIDTVVEAPALSREARHMEQVARRSFATDSNNPRWPLGELLSDLLEMYQLVQKYERGDSIDTAKVIALEKKLNCLTN